MSSDPSSRLDASRRSANPLAWGSAATKVKKKEENPEAKRAGNEETGLFDMVNRKRRGAMNRQGAGAPSRQRQRARSRPRARRGAPSFDIARCDWFMIPSRAHAR